MLFSADLEDNFLLGLLRLNPAKLVQVENTIKMVASAAMVGLMFSRIPENIWRGNVDCPGPARNSVITTSSKDVANANSAPEIKPGAITGNVILKNVCNGLAPRLLLARTRF